MSSRMRDSVQPDQEALRGRSDWLVALGFLLAVFLYVFLRLSPSTTHHTRFSLLDDGGQEPAANWVRPAELLRSASGVLDQANYYDASGALLWTSLAAAVLWITSLLSRKASDNRGDGAGTSRLPAASPLPPSGPFVPAAVPVFLLLMLRNQPQWASSSTAVGVLIGAGAAAGCIGLRELAERPLWRQLSAVVSGLFVFMLAGFWPAVLFGTACWVVQWRPDSRWGTGAIPLVSIAALALVSFIASPGPALAAPWFNPWEDVAGLLLGAAVHLSIPGVVLARRFAGWKIREPKKKGKAGSAIPWHQRSALRGMVAAGLLTAGGSAVWLYYDDQRHTFDRIDYLTTRGDFARALELGRGLKMVDLPTQIRLQRALYHTGRLGEELFSLPNQLASEPLPGVSGGIASCRPQARALLEMGLVSDAEHFAHEALEMEGNRPDLLFDLARINALKDRPAAARIFLNVLRTSPVNRAKAEAFLNELTKAAPDQIASSQLPLLRELDGIRSLMVTNDLPHEGLPAEALLSHHLVFNPGNRMAFEYLMTHYLLRLELRKLVDRLWQLDNFKYGQMPRHYEEALLLHQKLSGTRMELKRQVRPGTANRFARFSAAMEQRLYTTREGQRILDRDFGDTYWYYYYSAQSYLNSQPSRGATEQSAAGAAPGQNSQQ